MIEFKWRKPGDGPPPVWLRLLFAVIMGVATWFLLGFLQP